MKKLNIVLAVVFLGGCMICGFAAYFPRPQATVLPPAPPASLWTGFSYTGAYTIDVDSPNSLVDEPLSIQVSGLAPGQPVTIRLRFDRASSARYESFATFKASSDGKVQVDQAEPLYGTYTGVDPFGLFWSLAKVKTPSQSMQSAQAPTGAREPISFTVIAEANGQTLAQTTLQRGFMDEAQVAYQSIRTDGLVGSLFYPNDGKPHPTVITLGGSEGGLSEGMSALLASHGYTSLSLAYFGILPLPKSLVEIPLEYFSQAINWLKLQPSVDAGHIAVLGGSKGAEAALLVGATYPQDIRAAIAYKPSSIVWMGLYTTPQDYSQGVKSSWSLGGKGLPFASGALTWDMIGLFTGRSVSLAPSYGSGLKSKQAEQAAIQVEKINGPILLISGGKDQMWPSTQMSLAIMERLKAKGHAFNDQHLNYPEAGHAFYLPGLLVQTSEGAMQFGGTQTANAHAGADSWEKLLVFLQDWENVP